MDEQNTRERIVFVPVATAALDREPQTDENQDTTPNKGKFKTVVEELRNKGWFNK